MTGKSEQLLDLSQQGAVSTEMMLWAVGIAFAVTFTFPLWKHFIIIPPISWPRSGKRRRKRP